MAVITSWVKLYNTSLTAEYFSDANGNPLAFGQIPLKRPRSSGCKLWWLTDTMDSFTDSLLGGHNLGVPMVPLNHNCT